MEYIDLENSPFTMWAHGEGECKGDVCCLHKRTDHVMRSFPQQWRSDRGLMERTCPHGIGHPDPDHIDGLDSLPWSAAHTEFYGCTQEEYVFTQGVHGCDGCCWSEKDKATVDAARAARATLDLSRYIAPNAIEQLQSSGCDSGGCGCVCGGEDGPAATPVPTDWLPD